MFKMSGAIIKASPTKKTANIALKKDFFTPPPPLFLLQIIYKAFKIICSRDPKKGRVGALVWGQTLTGGGQF